MIPAGEMTPLFLLVASLGVERDLEWLDAVT
jgi:hypothetical protein